MQHKFLAPFEGKQRRMKFATYDLEWDPSNMQLRVAGLFDGINYYCFKSMGEFLERVLTREFRGTKFFAHAGGLADIQFVLAELLSWEDPSLSIEAAFSGSAAIIVKVSRDKHVWTFCDSFSLLRGSLKKIGASLGLEKGGDDYFCSNYDNSKPAGKRCPHELQGSKCIFHAPFGILKDYNELDCRILYDAIMRLEDEILELGGSVKPTLASTAMHLFRSEYLRRKILIHPKVSERARLAYVASRVEVIRPTCGKAHYYDINSSFPHSMLGPLPASPIEAITRHPKLPACGQYMALLDITVPEIYLPPIPVKKDAKVYFPYGTWQAWMMNEDIEDLLENGGTINRIHEVITFETFYDCAEYAQDIYERRKNSTDEFQRLVYKLLMNSLYGKFAEQPDKTALLYNPKSFECPHGDPSHKGPNGESLCVELLFPGAVLRTDTIEMAHNHVPISAAITARSRRALGCFLRDASQRGEVYYCDTDSLVTTAYMPTSSELGALKSELEIEQGRFLAPKLYCVNEQVKAKGFSKLNADQFESLARGKSVHFKRMLRVRESFRKGIASPTEILTSKTLRGARPKRRACGNNDTVPWHISEL